MRTLLFALIVLPSFCLSQEFTELKEIPISPIKIDNSNIEVLGSYAYSIMHALNIPTRDSYIHDKGISVHIIDGVAPRFSPGDSTRNIYPDSVHFIISSRTKSYISPSSLMETPWHYLFESAILIHELAHYFQKADHYDLSFYLPPTNDTSRSKKAIEYFGLYVSQPIEFDAYSVAAFYYLYYGDWRDDVINIMNSNEPLERKKRALILQYLKILKQPIPDI